MAYCDLCKRQVQAETLTVLSSRYQTKQTRDVCPCCFDSICNRIEIEKEMARREVVFFILRKEDNENRFIFLFALMIQWFRIGSVLILWVVGFLFWCAKKRIWGAPPFDMSRGYPRLDVYAHDASRAFILFGFLLFTYLYYFLASHV